MPADFSVGSAWTVGILPFVQTERMLRFDVANLCASRAPFSLLANGFAIAVVSLSVLALHVPVRLAMRAD